MPLSSPTPIIGPEKHRFAKLQQYFPVFHISKLPIVSSLNIQFSVSNNSCVKKNDLSSVWAKSLIFKEFIIIIIK